MFGGLTEDVPGYESCNFATIRNTEIYDSYNSISRAESIDGIAP